MSPQSQLSPSPSLAIESAKSSPQPAPAHGLNEIKMRYMLAPITFRTLCTINKSPSRQDILKKACLATEFRSFPIKPSEKVFFREANEHTAIPYPIKEGLSQPWHKVFLLVQVDLMRTEWPNKLGKVARKELHQDFGRMRKLLDQALRCLVDILGAMNDGKGVSTALDVLRSVKAGVWEGSEKQLLQVEGIGKVKMDRLIEAGIKTIQQLSRLEFYHIERILSRNPPFGQKISHDLAGFPSLSLNLRLLGKYTPPASGCTAPNINGQELKDCANSLSKSSWIVRVVIGFTNEQVPIWKKITPWATLVIEGDDGRLVWFWRGSLKRLTGGKEMIVALNASKGEVLRAVFACEETVGTMIRENLQV